MKRSVQIKHAIFTGGLAQACGVLEGQLADGFLTVFNDRNVGAFFRRLHGTAKRYRTTRSRLQPEGNHFQGVCQCQWLVMTTGNERAHLRKAGT